MFQWLNKINPFKRSIENPAVPLWSPTAYDYLVGKRSTAGIPVNRESVLGIAALWRGVNLISHKVGRLPLTVYKRQDDGGRLPDTEHPAWWLLSKRPSNLYTPFTFKSTLTSHALLHGNGYGYIFRDDIARPEEIIILSPEQTFPVFSKGQLYYVTRIGGEERKLLPENVLHLKGLSHDGLVGYSVIDVLRETFGLTLAQSRYASVFFRNNGSPGPTILKCPTWLKDVEARKKFREEWDKLHTGIDNSHKLALLEGGMDIVQNNIDHEAMQLIESRQFSIIEIANVLGIPPHKLGANVTTSYGSLESEERAFLNDCLDGWLTAWEEECELKLLKESQAVRDSHFVEFDRRSLEQADYKTRSESLIAEVNNGLRSDNEARAMLNLPSVGPDGDRLRMPGNITFIDLLAPKDDPATDEPEPEVETPATGEPDASEPVETDPVSPDDDDGTGPDGERLAGLLHSIVIRQLRRLDKALSAASKKEGFEPAQELARHLDVFVDAVRPASRNAEKVVDAFLDGLGDELEAVTREQIQAVLRRQDAWNLTKRLLA
jgi:HK97 family phage portal protein